MDNWLTSAGDQAAVLVTVAIVEGSGPREAGAKMLVSADRLFDTIGGGHLEMRAIEVARGMLAGDAAPARIERFALGPSLGQCCGGVVHLAFERVDAGLLAVLDALRQRRQEDSWRVSAIDGAAASALFDAAGKTITGADLVVPSAFARERAAHVLRDEAGRRWLVDPCLAPRAHLTLFGAGHVGAAIVRALAELPCNVTWVDEREDMFPATVPGNVRIEASDTPEALVGEAPAGGSFLVMTHSHALDQRLTEAIMARADVGWFGLIGSQTKRKQFEHRLRARGVAAERIDAMVCPIGMPGITNKAPAVIAIAVAAQLITVWEAAAAASGTTAPLRLVASGGASKATHQYK
ncbi:MULTISPECIES: xanthine dehydrogenase accessory protein XdhC [unclassified Janthinobacterium]|uniref:xanthine dehydrogenase accessory protein XdhC n=1 Tax=unclassified Janthinobacterium TaxID=2610881 RepID=UPI000372A413|nr:MULTISPECIES: xanthine dehydrogenase accessory protein XdhC [unclassified Janthinobacterium]MEC5163934.1 xanthine dehydrogenase accessory factor [Janthinobacterium sp. CG_S6]